MTTYTLVSTTNLMEIMVKSGVKTVTVLIFFMPNVYEKKV